MADKKTKQFYNSKAWQMIRGKVLARDHYLCQHCLKKNIIQPAETVHHIEHLKENWDKALDESNLISLCLICHNIEHPEKRMWHKRKHEEQPKRRARVIESKGNENIT